MYLKIYAVNNIERYAKWDNREVLLLISCRITAKNILKWRKSTEYYKRYIIWDNAKHVKKRGAYNKNIRLINRNTSKKANFVIFVCCKRSDNSEKFDNTTKKFGILRRVYKKLNYAIHTKLTRRIL